MNTGLDQYMDIFKDAVEDSAAKITKSFEKILIEVIILFMVIPRKINFTQMGRYGLHVEQTYRNAFGLKKSKCIDWLKLNVSLAKRFLGKQGRWAIAIDPSYISKAGKKTPHIGRFWSGCAQSVKHGLEIMGIGLIDIDTKDCMMLRAHQSLNNKELSLRNKTMVDFYISVIKRYRKELLKLSTSFCVLWSILIVIFTSPIISCFGKDETMQEIARIALRANTIMFFTFGFQFVYSTLYMAIGRARQSLLLNIGRQGLFFIPIILLLPSYWELNGVLYAQPIADVFATLMTLFFAVRIHKEIGHKSHLTTENLQC